jgi:osmotically-inducible protein OsmY
MNSLAQPAGGAMKSDADIKRDVEAELKWDPRIDETDIAVTVNGRAVTLSGYARNYLERHEAEQMARRVGGVAAVANDIQVRVSHIARTTDPEIAREAVAALKSELPSAWEKIQVLVDSGHVRLEGTVEWHFMRERAEAALRRVSGVLSLRNHIVIAPTVAAADVKSKIEQAFKRSAEVDASHVTVESSGTEVTLRGDVATWTERDQAQRSAWCTPGVTKVINNLQVKPPT